MDLICQMALKDWRSLTSISAALSEAQLEEMIKYEVENRRRITFVERMHQKLTRIRAERERKELIKKCIGERG